MSRRNTINTWDPVAGEAVDVPDHSMRVEDDITSEQAKRKALNGELDEEELPLTLSSDMSADPCEGVQGSYSAVVESDCPECPSEYGIVQEAHTLAGVGMETCLLCEYIIRDWR